MRNVLLFLGIILFHSTVYSFSICQIFSFPGTYQLGGDLINLEPMDPNDAAICITESGVTADGMLHNVRQSDTNDVSNFAGIRVAPNLHNVTIQNFFITGCTGPAIIIGAGCTSIKIVNTNIADCDAGGILFEGENGDPITNSLISNCNVVSCTGWDGGSAYGLHIAFGEDLQINNCLFNKNDAQENNDGYGALIESSTNCFFNDCHATENGGNQLGVGIQLDQSNHCSLQNCVASNNIARSVDGRSVGFLLTNCSHSALNSCVAKGNNNIAQDAYGFELNSGNNNGMSNCISQDNQGSHYAAGFVLNNGETQSTLKDSIAKANDGITGSGFGILLDGSDHCVLMSNELTGNKGDAQGIGLIDTTIDTTNLIMANFAFVNTTTGFEVTRTVGELPVITVPLYDFSGLTNESHYINVYFTL